MKLHKIKELTKDLKKEKNTVAELLSGYRRTCGGAGLVNDLRLRMDEIDSFILVIHSSLENKDHDESFYREYVGNLMYLFEQRFDELQIMIDALIEENADKKAIVKAAA